MSIELWHWQGDVQIFIRSLKWEWREKNFSQSKMFSLKNMRIYASNILRELKWWNCAEVDMSAQWKAFHSPLEFCVFFIPQHIFCVGEVAFLSSTQCLQAKEWRQPGEFEYSFCEIANERLSLLWRRDNYMEVLTQLLYFNDFSLDFSSRVLRVCLRRRRRSCVIVRGEISISI